MEQLVIDSGAGSSATQVNVHPVVLFSILDQYIRRDAAGDKVIGAWRCVARARLFWGPGFYLLSSSRAPPSLSLPPRLVLPPFVQAPSSAP
jgi:hypothetical protein